MSKTIQHCNAVQRRTVYEGTYIENQLGPAVLAASMTANNCSKHRCSNHGTCWGDAAQGEKFCDCDKGFGGVDCKVKSKRRKWL